VRNVGWAIGVIGLAVLAVLGVAVYDVTQRRHAILRNYPVIGHFRYALESFGPELRQYILTSNDEEKPFSRDQRRWIYTSAYRRDNTFGFGTDNHLDTTPDYLIVAQAAFPELPNPAEPAGPEWSFPVPCVKVVGGDRRRGAFRPSSLVNISGMSFGSLSGAAVESLNRAAALIDCYQNTGEGGISLHHRHGGDLVVQVGTGYFGCREADGSFSLPRLVDVVAGAPVRAIEVKLSQGAKPGLGGLLPGVKVTPEIARARGIPVGEDCRSPARHSAFDDVDGLVEFVEEVAAATGLPVGIKSAVGESEFWVALAERMERTGLGPDFITVDGGEGGTGAAPLAFADHVSLPFLRAFPRAYVPFAERSLTDRVVFIGSGRLGLADRALAAMALGCDLIHVGREAMLAIGCIQAQRCHTDRCPTGVATQSPRRERGLDPDHKSVRAANYLATLRFELLRLARACGHRHPAQVTSRQIEVLDSQQRTSAIGDLAGYRPEWGLPARSDIEAMSAEWPTVGSGPGR
jgi:glutamate synthase domain-containing protein 2